MDALLNARTSHILDLIIPYVLAELLTGAITAVLFMLRNDISPTLIALLFLLPVGLSTVLWGLGPGIVTAVTAFFAFNYFFIKPYYTLHVHQTQDLLVLLVFLVIAVVFSQLVGRTRQSLAQATAREREAIQLYEFSSLLAGLHAEVSLLEAITQKTCETFQADQVELFVVKPNGQQPVVHKTTRLATTPEDLQTQPPDITVPLQTARGLLGEVRLWRSQKPLQPEDERLLRTYASQAVLAIERARLLQTETRAKVLEESDRLKTSLLSSVSHELRSPLATIKASVSSLRSADFNWDSDARQELLAAVEEETDYLNQLVENLLNMSRIEAGALKPIRQWNSLEEIVSGVVRRFRKPTAQSFLNIQVSLPEDLPLVPVDFLQMEQVFTNLISNSMKYSPEGSPIGIRAWVIDPQQVRVQVSNQGPQVPMEHLDRIFDKFYRITAADRVTGTGLGLSICKGIIEAHGGKIWAENLPNGLAFNFTLPLTWQGEQPRLPEELPALSSNQRDT
jgi:two-component system, OmpR family, sensor histidine kinase KdpD